MIQFEHPLLLWLLPLIFLVILLIVKMTRGRITVQYPWVSQVRRQGYMFPLVSLLLGPKQPGSKMPYKSPNRTLLLIIPVFVCFVLALAAPFIPGKPRLVKQPQREFVLLIDNSIGMMIRDYSVSGRRIERMQFLKAMASRILAHFAGDRFAVILYSDKAALYVPFTHDSVFLIKQLGRIETELTGRSNGLGQGMALAAKTVLQHQQHSAKNNTNKARPAVVLLSHGTRIVDPDTVSEMLALYRSKKIKLFTVGIGATVSKSQNESQRKITDVSGVLYDPVDVLLLKSLALQTEGRFTMAGSKDAIIPVLNMLARQKNLNQTLMVNSASIHLHVWPMTAGLIMLLLWQLISTLRYKS